MLKAHSSDLLEAPKQDFKQDIRAYFDRIAPELDRWSRRNRYYYSDLVRLHQFIIPPGSRVLEIGCGTGDLLQATAPALGVGLEFAPAIVACRITRRLSSCPGLTSGRTYKGARSSGVSFALFLHSSPSGHL